MQYEFEVAILNNFDLGSSVESIIEKAKKEVEEEFGPIEISSQDMLVIKNFFTELHDTTKTWVMDQMNAGLPQLKSFEE